MSRPVKRSIPCPQCGKLSEFVSWTSLNVTLNPAEKTALLTGRLTTFVCPGCGHTAQVKYPLLYHDIERAFMLWLVPRGPKGEAGNVPEEFPPEMRKEFGDDYRFRRVETLNDLIEKILIDDAGLDDRVIELSKFVVAQKIMAERKSGDFDLRFNVMTGEGNDAKMDFTVLSPNGNSGIGVTFHAMYDLMLRDFAGALREKLPDPWPVVDHNYAKQLIAAKAAAGGGKKN
jgi:hypothetical protein